MVFETITIDNFLSIGHADIDLHSPGVSLVVGVNKYDPLSASNGAGKSSIFEAILWNLTGATSRGSSNVSNLSTNGSASVTLSFMADTASYQVTRKANPSSLQIIKDGEDISGNTFSKSKKILSDLLSFINYDMLSSIIILTQGLGGRLSNLKPSERKSRLEMFSSLQELIDEVTSKVGEVGSQISEEQASASRELADIETRITRNKELITEYRQKLSDLKKSQDVILSEAELAELKSEIETQTNALRETEQQITSENALRMQGLSKQQGYEHSLSMYAKEANTLKEQYMSVLNSICPTCGQPIDNPQLVAQYESRIQEISNSMDEVRKSLKEVKDRLSINNLPILENTREQLRVGIQNANDLIAESAKHTSSAEVWESMTSSLESEIAQLGDKAFPLRAQVSALDKDLQIAKWYKSSIPRKFRNFLLDSVVDYLNKRLEHYSKYLFTDRKVHLQSDGNNLAIMLDNLEFENLSGGEGRRADLLIQLALRDLAINQSGFFCNLLVMDEVFDYLDDTGINSFMLMIDKESSFSESLMVITHRTGIDIPVSRKVTVTKNTNGVSSVKITTERY